MAVDSELGGLKKNKRCPDGKFHFYTVGERIEKQSFPVE